MSKKEALTPMQDRFIDELLIDLNATQAAIRAGSNPKSATQTASRWLTKAHVVAEIARRKGERSVRTQVTADEVVQRLQLLASAELPNAASWDSVSVGLVDSDQLSPAGLAAGRGLGGVRGRCRA